MVTCGVQLLSHIFKIIMVSAKLLMFLQYFTRKCFILSLLLYLTNVYHGKIIAKGYCKGFTDDCINK